MTTYPRSFEGKIKINFESGHSENKQGIQE